MKVTRIALALALAGISVGAQATNGYFGHGSGMKAKGMAGASTAMIGDAFGGANNPATMAFAGDRLDLGVDLFSPIREATRTNSTVGGVPIDPDSDGDTDVTQIIPAINGSSESDSNIFAIPEFGYNKMLNQNLALGITVYGNGGMNTNYKRDQLGGNANLLGGNTRLGVDLMQLIVAPTVAYKIAPNHSIGISPLIGYQRFKAEGLQAFGLISQDFGGANSVTNNGYDDAFGYGVRVGYFGRLAPTFAVGAAYASRMNFQEFDKYKGLFAEQGDLDIPENYNVGAAWQATPSLLFALDYQHISYSDVKAISNPSTNFFTCMGGVGGGVGPHNAANPFCMGGNAGPGFGWSDMDIWKLGMEYKYSKQLTLRAGYSHSDQPIPARDVEFNIIAPAVIENHATLGLTYTMASGDELTVSYMHGFANDVSGPSWFFGGTDKIEMYQNSLGVQYSWKM